MIFTMLLCQLNWPQLAYPQRYMEALDRGLVAIPDTNGKGVFLSWRLGGDEYGKAIGFDLYRRYKGASWEKLNSEPIGLTNFIDTAVILQQSPVYRIEAIGEGKDTERKETALWEKGYQPIPLRPLEGYSANDVSVGDLDGDGQYELVVHRTGKGHDNSHDGYTDPPVLEAYRLDGTFLWRINLGKNIREGGHYTQFMVMDLDADGKAEIACKTADGTRDGKGKIIGDSLANWVNGKGRILDGPEYLTVFDGATGEAIHTVDYIPNRYPLDSWGTKARNDTNGNRADRFLAAVAYLDGKKPSLIMSRGYYARTAIAAWDFDGRKLQLRWLFDTKDGEHPYAGQGFHNISVADIDDDGKDEIVFGSMAIDDDGSPIYSTGWGHGDAQHLTDLLPDRPGLEIFTVHEHPPADKPGAALRDARTGEALWTGAFGQDVGRGVAADIDPTNPGAELWFSGSKGLLDAKGQVIGPVPSSTNFLVWWDGDLSRELLNSIHVDKYGAGRIFSATGCTAINGTKSNPALCADILGDWREELIFPSQDHQELRIYTTNTPTEHVLYTLMHDPRYRLSVAAQNVAYNQPTHTGFYLGAGMKPAPVPYIKLINGKNVKRDGQ